MLLDHVFLLLFVLRDDRLCLGGRCVTRGQRSSAVLTRLLEFLVRTDERALELVPLCAQFVAKARAHRGYLVGFA